MKSEILSWGASLVGFADLEGLLPKRWSTLNTGISIAIRLSDAIIAEIKTKPTHLYADHYHIMNRSLDQIALRTANLLQSGGYKALPIPASPIAYVGKLGGHISHKMVATRAGLGWIGKSTLLVTPQYGPRIRLVSILTDAPFQTSSPCNESNCGKCTSCIIACPKQALKNAVWTPEAQREDLLEVDRCREMLHQNRELIGTSVCGVCINACPVGKDN